MPTDRAKPDDSQSFSQVEISVATYLRLGKLVSELQAATVGDIRRLYLTGSLGPLGRKALTDLASGLGESEPEQWFHQCSAKGRQMIMQERWRFCPWCGEAVNAQARAGKIGDAGNAGNA